MDLLPGTWSFSLERSPQEPAIDNAEPGSAAASFAFQNAAVKKREVGQGWEASQIDRLLKVDF